MNINFSIEEAVRKRYSVRNYADREIEDDKKKEIKSFIDSLQNPFGKEVKYYYLDKEYSNKKQKLGTYGVIKGAKNYIGTSIKLEPMALEALGYELELLILYLTYQDIGTCWLGGTFDRKGFSSAMDVNEEELFPIITPYGYAAEKKHIKEIAMRKAIKADGRKDWSELFFNENFHTPLAKNQAGDLAFPLEMLRLGPSASNKQPWRIVLNKEALHFYQHKEPKYSEHFPYDIQKIDMGIAAAHLDLSVKEKGIKGYFSTNSNPKLNPPKNTEYVFSWVRDVKKNEEYSEIEPII